MIVIKYCLKSSYYLIHLDLMVDFRRIIKLFLYVLNLINAC